MGGLAKSKCTGAYAGQQADSLGLVVRFDLANNPITYKLKKQKVKERKLRPGTLRMRIRTRLATCMTSESGESVECQADCVFGRSSHNRIIHPQNEIVARIHISGRSEQRMTKAYRLASASHDPWMERSLMILSSHTPGHREVPCGSAYYCSCRAHAY